MHLSADSITLQECTLVVSIKCNFPKNVLYANDPYIMPRSSRCCQQLASYMHALHAAAASSYNYVTIRIHIYLFHPLDNVCDILLVQLLVMIRLLFRLCCQQKGVCTNMSPCLFSFLFSEKGGGLS